MTSRPSAWPRRWFLAGVSASLSSALSVACDDESVVIVDAPDNPPSISPESHALLEAYFGAGLADAEFIGGYHADKSGLDTEAAYDATEHVRAVADTASSSADAVVTLEDELQHDFLDLRVVAVAGWTLGRTEVDLCLLAWLASSA